MLEQLKHPKARRTFIAFCLVGALLAAVGNYLMNRLVVDGYRQTCENHPTQPSIERSPQIAPSDPRTDQKPTTGINTFVASDTQCTGWQTFVAETGPGVAVNIVSSFLVAAFLVAVLAIVVEEEESVSDVHLLFESKVRASLIDALDKSSSWIHDGHVASWVRRYVLPKFSDDCRRHQATRNLRVAILDPRNEATCEAYLAHIRSLEPEEQRLSSLTQVQLEICTTLYSFAHASLSPHLHLEIFFKSATDYVRRDIASTRAFWTTPGKLKPSIVFENRKTSTYYHLSIANFEASIGSLTALPIQQAAKFVPGTNTKPTDVEKVIETALGSLPAFCSTEFCAAVLAKFLQESRHS